MTIITKPISEKKADKLEEPLVENIPTKDDVEAGGNSGPQFVILRTRVRRVSSATTVCMFLTALLVMSIGIIGGVYLYRQMVRSEVQRFWCSIPYQNAQGALYTDDWNTQNSFHGSYIADSDIFQNLQKSNKVQSGLNEEFEVDLVNDAFEKIDVPEFRGGRRGRFIHDFQANKTGIIDLDYKRCFIMPLDRHRVLPPRSLFDLVRKLWNGYYDVDTDVVRQQMRVVIPPITNYDSVGHYISRECKNYPTYMLEKATKPIVKRSASEEQPVLFTEFAGNKISEYDFVNLHEVEAYESEHHSVN